MFQQQGNSRDTGVMACNNFVISSLWCGVKCQPQLQLAEFFSSQHSVRSSKAFGQYICYPPPLSFGTTGCPKVRVYFDIPLFSDRSEQIMKSFDMVIAECGWFF